MKNEKEKHGSETSDGMKAMFVNRQSKGKGPKCYQCGKFGHIKQNCRELNSPKLDDDKNEVMITSIRLTMQLKADRQKTAQIVMKWD